MFAITALALIEDKSLSESLKDKSSVRHRQYGTESTWMKLNVFDS